MFSYVALVINVAVSVSGNDCGGGDLSEDNSEHLGICHGNRSPTPSPLMAEVTSSLATPPEEGMHMDLDQVSSDEPVVRKHRVSESFVRLVASKSPPL